MVEVQPGGVGYTYLDKHGSVLDHGDLSAVVCSLLGDGLQRARRPARS